MRRKLAPLVVFFGACLLSGCSPTPVATTLAKATTFESYVSLAPSNTEIIYAIGAQDHLMAVSNQCDYPKSATEKPKVGTFTSVDLEKLSTIKPAGLFLVDGQETLSAMVEKHPELHCSPVVLHNRTLDDIAKNIETIGERTGHAAEGKREAAAFTKTVSELRTRPLNGARKRKVFLCIWPDPLITVGKDSYLNDAVTACGGTNIAENINQAYPQFSTEQLVVTQPDVIILPHEARSQDFHKKAPWNALKAVKDGRVYFLPPRDEDRLSRPTPRLAEGLTWLAKVINRQETEKAFPVPPLGKSK